MDINLDREHFDHLTTKISLCTFDHFSSLGFLYSIYTVDRGDFVLPGDLVYFGKFDCFFTHFAYNRYFQSFYALSNRKYICFVKFW